MTGVLALRRELVGELEAERRRAAIAEARCRDAEEAAARALESFEERRIVAAELRTMLDATEYRITTLEAEVGGRDSERRALGESHRAEIDGLRHERDAVVRTLADVERERDAERERWREERIAIADQGARSEADRRALQAMLEERSVECQSLADELRVAVEGAAQIGGRFAETTAILEEAFAESAALRGLAEDLRRAAEAEREAGAAALAERDALAARCEASLGDLGAAAARIDGLQRTLVEYDLLHEEDRRRAEALSLLVGERDARNAELEAAIAALRGESERSARSLAEALRAKEGSVAALESSLSELRAEAQRNAVALAEVTRERDLRIGELDEELSNLRAEGERRTESLHAALRQKETRVDELEQSLASLRDETERNAAALSQSVREKESRVAELGEALTRIGTEGEQRVVSLMEVVREKDEWAAELESALEVVRGDVGRRDVELHCLRGEIAALRLDGERAASELAETRSVLLDLQHRHEEIHRERETLLSERDGIRGERDAARAEGDARRIDLERRDEDLGRVAAQMRGVVENAARLEGQIVDLQQRNAQLVEERGRLAAAAADLEGSLRDTDARARSAMQALEQSTTEIGSRETALAEAVSEREHLGERLNALAAERESLADGLSAARAELETARRDADVQRHAAEAAASRSSALDQQVRVLETERDRADQSLAQLRQALEARAAEVESQQERLEQTLRDQVAERERGDRAESERAGLEETAAALRRDLEAALEALAVAAAEREATVRLLREERDHLERRCESSGRERAELEELLVVASRELEETRQSATERFAQGDAAHAELQVRLAEAEDARRKAREDLAELERGLTGAEEARRRAEEELVELRRGSQEVESARQHADEERAALRRDLEETEHARRRAEEERGEFGRCLEAVRRQAEEELAELRMVAGRGEEEMRELRAALERARAEAERERDARAEFSGEREARQRELALWREQAEVARIEVATLVAQLAEVSARPSQSELEMRVAELEQSLQLGRLRESSLQTAVNDMQEQLLREQAHAASLWSDRESQAHFREALESALAEARARSTELEETLQLVQRGRPEEAAEERAPLLARVEELETRLAEAQAERAPVGEQETSLRATIEVLERECEHLRRHGAGADDRDRQRGEVGRLQARIEELERLQRDAVQRHTAAVNGYMLELNQRTETLRQRDAEVHRLTEEVSVLQAACDDAVSQVAEMRHEREPRPARGREADSTRGGAPRAEPPHSREAAPESKREREELRLAEPKAAAEEKKRPSPTPPHRRVATAVSGPVTVVHVDDDAGCQESVRASVTRFAAAQYVSPAQLQEKAPAGRRLLAVNMLSRSVDPVTTITESAKLGIEDPSAFTYFAYSGRGFVLGMVDFFPHPFETDACASRLLGRPGGLQRLLAVSEDVDLMSGIREVLGRVRCSAATAFDARQALDLVPMIKPEVVLVDLALPRGEALRIVSRLRTDPKTASIAVAVLWTTPITAKDLAQSAMRVVRDYTLTPDEVGRSLERVLVDEEMGLVASDGIRDVG